ncbi:MAG: N4-gp56 family major capsid protein [Bacillota bacterium]|jgi:N4-gp56 family major capsid protein
MTTTKLANLINPQVMGPMVSQEMEEKMVFADLCEIDYTLQGAAGDTLSLPVYSYIGDATIVAEGESIPITQLSATSTTAQVKKAAKGLELTDEAVLSAYGDPVGEAAKQLGQAIANKVDTDALAVLETIGTDMTEGDGTKAISADLVADALVKFGQLIEGDKVLIVAPKQLAALRKSEDWIKSTDMGVEILTSGCVGMIHGCQVMVSTRVSEQTSGSSKVYHNFIVKPGALGLCMKREPQIEEDRDIVKKLTVITADEHYVCYLKDESKAIKIITAAETATL